MIADSGELSVHSGQLAPDVHLPAESRYSILDFIADQLAPWRSRPERPTETAEDFLAAQLCGHLNSAARRSSVWDRLQFRREEPELDHRSRRLDMAVAPCNATIWIEGRRHTDFDTLLPIECKRLPTPAGPDRDEREYVVTRNGRTGGIQRFKEGLHGARHVVGAMIGFVQAQTPSHWINEVRMWIDDLVRSHAPGWDASDHLQAAATNRQDAVSVYDSEHRRQQGLPPIKLRHMWVGM